MRVRYYTLVVFFLFILETLLATENYWSNIEEFVSNECHTPAEIITGRCFLRKLNAESEKGPEQHSTNNKCYAGKETTVRTGYRCKFFLLIFMNRIVRWETILCRRRGNNDIMCTCQTIWNDFICRRMVFCCIGPTSIHVNLSLLFCSFVIL